MDAKRIGGWGPVAICLIAGASQIVCGHEFQVLRNPDWDCPLATCAESGRVIDVSGDGKFVTGLDRRNTYRWSAESGYERASLAGFLSRDGSTIVGAHFIWTESGGLEELIHPEGEAFRASDVSSDGQVVLGEDNVIDRRTPGGPLVHGFDSLRASPILENVLSLSSLSGDGTRAVGGLSREGSAPINAVIYYSDRSGHYLLGGPSAEFPRESFANAISTDGRVVVGAVYETIGEVEAFRWTEDTGVQMLGVPTGWNRTTLNGVSGNGVVHIGTAFGAVENTAVVWTERSGWKRIEELLELEGAINLEGVRLTEAVAISEDGTVVVGNGFDSNDNPIGWRAVISVPEPSAIVLLLPLVGSRMRRRGPGVARRIEPGGRCR